MAPEQEQVALASLPAGIETDTWDNLVRIGRLLWLAVHGALGSEDSIPATIELTNTATDAEPPFPLDEGLLATVNFSGAVSGPVAVVAGGPLGAVLGAEGGTAGCIASIAALVAPVLAKEGGQEVAATPIRPLRGSREEITLGLAQLFPEGQQVLSLHGEISLAGTERAPFEVRLLPEFVRALATLGRLPAERQVPRAAEPEASAPAAIVAPAPSADIVDRASSFGSSPGLDEARTFLASSLGAMREVELEVIARFGEVDMKLENVLALSPGSVIELDRRVEDPVDILVNGKILARAEVVVVGEKFGLRVCEVLK